MVGDDGGRLEGVVDPVDGVLLDGHQEAGGHLRLRGARIEEGGRGVREGLPRQVAVRLEDRPEGGGLRCSRTGGGVGGRVDTAGDAHQEVLRSLHHLPVDPQEVGLLQGLEGTVVVGEVPLVDHLPGEPLLVLLDEPEDVLRNHGCRRTRLGVPVCVERLHCAYSTQQGPPAGRAY